MTSETEDHAQCRCAFKFDAIGRLMDDQFVFPRFLHQVCSGIKICTEKMLLQYYFDCLEMQIKPGTNDSQRWPLQTESAKPEIKWQLNGCQVRKPKSCRGLPANATHCDFFFATVSSSLQITVKETIVATGN